MRRLVILVAVAVLVVTGCQSSRAIPAPPCDPEVVTKDVPSPYPVLVKVETLEPMVLPGWPTPPSPEADEAEWKLFAQEVNRIAKERDATKDGRIAALEELIASHNRLRVDPTPVAGNPPSPVDPGGGP